jgi:hypothetical protein
VFMSLLRATGHDLIGRTHMPQGVHAAWAPCKITPAGVASWRQMSKSPSRRFPVTVTHLPVTRCQICHRTVAYRPGNLTEVMTEHYRRAHPERSTRPRFPVAGRGDPLYYPAVIVTNAGRPQDDFTPVVNPEIGNGDATWPTPR